MPLDDCLHALQPTPIPHPTRSSLHRCLQRHGISRLPDTDGRKPQRSRFKRCPIGFCHLGIAEVRAGRGKPHLFVAIDHRTSKSASAELREKATRRVAGDFLPHLVAAVPYGIDTVLTDNGTHFTDPTGDGAGRLRTSGRRGQRKCPSAATPSRQPAPISTSSTG